MKTKLLFTTALFYVCLVFSQGNTAATAEDIDGAGVSGNLLFLNNGATASSFDSDYPSASSVCSHSGVDAFYKHTVPAGMNKTNVSIATVGPNLGGYIDYNIYKAPAGDLSSMTEVTCDEFIMVVLVGGNFNYSIDNVAPGDVIYVRTFEPNNISGQSLVGLTTPINVLLNSLLSATVVSMSSEYDPSLSIADTAFNSELKVLTKETSLELVNNVDFSKYAVYGIEGKRVLNGAISSSENIIDIASLNTGIYILNLQSKSGAVSRKFAKR